jgi:DNA-binding GntR family transcriptional regulator
MMDAPKFPYRRVVDDLRAQIESGELTGQLPTRQKLAEIYSVSHMTIDRAVRELKAEGLIFGEPGLGMFVADH